MHHRLLPALATLLITTACMGRPAPQPEPSPTPPAPAAETPAPAPTTLEPAPEPPPPAAATPAEAFTSFRAALEAGNGTQAWSLLSSKTQQMLGGSPEKFAQETSPEMRLAYGGFISPQTVLDERVAPDLATVAVAGDRTNNGGAVAFDVSAAALVKEEGQWRIALGIGPVLSASTPAVYDPATPTAARLGFQATADSPIRNTRLWLDGKALEPHVGGPSQQSVAVSTEIPKTLTPGQHIVVALAVDDAGNPAVLGWSFKVRD